METKFQTSFIPKKPLTTDGSSKVIPSHSSGGTSIFMIIGVLVFIASVAGAVFSVVWKGVLINSQKQYKISLARNKESFNISLIEDLKKASAKLDLTRNLVKSHASVSEVFNIIGALTIEGVRFDNLSYDGPTGNGESGTLAKVSLKGVAKGYSSIAFQSDVFGKSSQLGTNKVIKNPLLSDMSLDQNGNVAFNFSANIDPQLFTYEKVHGDQFKSESVEQDNSANASDALNNN